MAAHQGLLSVCVTVWVGLRVGEPVLVGIGLICSLFGGGGISPPSSADPVEDGGIVDFTGVAELASVGTAPGGDSLVFRSRVAVS